MPKKGLHEAPFEDFLGQNNFLSANEVAFSSFVVPAPGIGVY
jgi:hypothetical protein